MQEEVTQKTIALYVKVGKGAARLTEQALQKAIQKFLEQKSKPAHGKQTMRQLMKQNAGVSNIEITDSNIKAFESTAKKYNIDFSLKKVRASRPVTCVFQRPGRGRYDRSVSRVFRKEAEPGEKALYPQSPCRCKGQGEAA